MPREPTEFEKVLIACDVGDLNKVRRWLASGGNPNEATARDFQSIPYGEPTNIMFLRDETATMIAALRGNTAVMSALIEAGADVNLTNTSTFWPQQRNALILALGNAQYEAVRLLLDNGADRATFRVAPTQWSTDDVPMFLMDHRVVRMFYLDGVDLASQTLKGCRMGGHRLGFLDPTMDRDATVEEAARAYLDKHGDSPDIYIQDEIIRPLMEAVAIFEAVRLANGSYRDIMLAPPREFLRLRTLLSRGRATLGPTTPEVVARLFGGTRARPRGPPEKIAGVPNAAFWKIMQYWRLGADWRRP